MPTEWQHHADSVGTAVSTEHDLDGTLKSVTVQLDSFRVRSWTEDVDEIEERTGKDISSFHYDEKTDQYDEYDGGSNATFRFDVDGETALLESIEPKDGDSVKPRHMMLLPAAERVVEQLDGVRAAFPFDPLRQNYEDAVDAGVFIERLDG